MPTLPPRAVEHERLRVGREDLAAPVAALPVRHRHRLGAHLGEAQLAELGEPPLDGPPVARRAGEPRAHLDGERAHELVGEVALPRARTQRLGRRHQLVRERRSRGRLGGVARRACRDEKGRRQQQEDPHAPSSARAEAKLRRQLLTGFGRELAGTPVDAQPAARELGDDVEVHVHHHLVRGGAVVLQHVVGRGAGHPLDRPRQARQHTAEGGGGLVGELVEMRLALLGDHQRMAAGERIDVEEGEHVLVLVDAVAGDLAVEDAVEDGALAVAHRGGFGGGSSAGCRERL